MNFKKLVTTIVALGLAMSIFAGCSNAKEELVELSTEEVAVETTAEISSEKYDEFFVNSEWLKENISKENLVIIDARGEDAYNKGHIAGAVMTSWQALSDMSVEFATPNWGSVVDKSILESTIRNLGITNESEVVVYADTKSGWGEEGRLYWTLKIAGIENVKMLDGGYNIWSSLGNEISKDTTEIVSSDFKIENLNLAKSINTEMLSSNLNEYKIVDTRDLEEYEGAVKFGEARGGHIPGAMWISYKSMLNSDGTLKSENDLNIIFAEAGLEKDDKIVTYCTAGIRSAHMAVILEMLGYENALNYDESFYVWANDKDQKLGRVVKEKSYNYYTSEDLRNTIEANNEIILLDIQVKEEFETHHIKGAIETNAYPVKTGEEKAKLDNVLAAIKESSNDVVIVCPRGGGGAERTFNYLLENEVKSSRIYVLEGGQSGWGYNELLEK